MADCPVCKSDNVEFAVKCVSCGSYLQQTVKTLDLFSTIFNVWRNPSFAIRRILLAEHKNYTVPIALLESVGLSFLSLFIVKGADIYSLELWKIIVAGTGLGVAVFFPAIYLTSLLGFSILRAWKRGVTLKGFISGIVYSMHPIAFGTAVFLPTGVAVFGPYLFSNNPSPRVINAPPFYLIGFLETAAIAASFGFIVILIQIIFGAKIRALPLAAILVTIFAASLEIAKALLLAQ